jgi:hypothetical protein
VDTKEEAALIRTLHCRQHYDGRFILNNWSGNPEDILGLAEALGLKENHNG